MQARIYRLYTNLNKLYGAQKWWPAKSPFEVMVGAILTQNTAWSNVEKAITAMRKQSVLSPAKILALKHDELAALIRPSGYFNQKAKRLQIYSDWFLSQGGLRGLSKIETTRLRTALLGLHGIGPETADDILLYALDRPVFVIDAYTRRLFSRCNLIRGDEPYEELRLLVERSLKNQTQAMNEFHALIVLHAKEHCQKNPVCNGCPLTRSCQFYKNSRKGE